MTPDPDAKIGFVPPGGNDIWIKPDKPPPIGKGTSAAERAAIREAEAAKWDRRTGVKWLPPHDYDPLGRMEKKA